MKKLLGLLLLASVACSKDDSADDMPPYQMGATFQFPYEEFTIANTRQLNKDGDIIYDKLKSMPYFLEYEEYDNKKILDVHFLNDTMTFIKFGDVIDTLKIEVRKVKGVSQLLKVSKDGEVIWDEEKDHYENPPVYPKPE